MEENGQSNGGQLADTAKAAFKKFVPLHVRAAIIAGAGFFILIMIVIMSALMAIAGDDESSGSNGNNGSSCAPAGSCVYNIKGFYIASKGNISQPMNITDLQVRLMQAGAVGSNSCGGTYGEPLEGEELVPFEKYILGVVYAEMGDVAGQMEARKAQAVAARSYILARATDMGSSHGNKLEQEDGKWILQVTNCVSDQVYCDPDKGCSKKVAANNQWGNVYSGTDNPITYKGPLSQESELRKAVSDTAGKVLVNAEGNVIYAGYVSTDQNAFASMDASGNDYTEILISHYNSGARPYGAANIDSGTCNSNGSSTSCGSSTGGADGEFRNWKQLTSLGAPWGGVPMGGDTINNIGCLATSIAIQAANSGAAQTGLGFNPGTFVTSCIEKGVIDGSGNMYQGRVSEIVPGFGLADQKVFFGMAQVGKIKVVRDMLNDGCYPVMEVKGAGNCIGCGQHWVAIDKVDDNEIYMMDPASNDTGVFAKYGNAGYSVSCYKKQ